MELYRSFLKEIDAIDNGQNPFEGEKLYSINTSLTKRVSMLNFIPSLDSDPSINFLEALDLVEHDFLSYLMRILTLKIPNK